MCGSQAGAIFHFHFYYSDMPFKYLIQLLFWWSTRHCLKKNIDCIKLNLAQGLFLYCSVMVKAHFSLSLSPSLCRSMYVFGGFSSVLLNDVLIYRPPSCEAFVGKERCEAAGPGVRCVWRQNRCLSWEPSFPTSTPAYFCPAKPGMCCCSYSPETCLCTTSVQPTAWLLLFTPCMTACWLIILLFIPQPRCSLKSDGSEGVDLFSLAAWLWW